MCYNVFITYGGIDMVQILDDIEGVGPKTLSNLQKLNINSVLEVLNGMTKAGLDILKERSENV